MVARAMCQRGFFFLCATLACTALLPISAPNSLQDGSSAAVDGVCLHGCEGCTDGESVLEAAIDVMPEPVDSSLRVICQVLGDEALWSSLCGSACSVSFSVDGSPQESLVPMLLREELNIYVRNMKSGTHTLSMVVWDSKGNNLTEATSQFEWVPAKMTPFEAMERILEALSQDARSPSYLTSCLEPPSCSCVRRLRWGGLDCSLPRAVMRVYQLESVEVCVLSTCI